MFFAQIIRIGCLICLFCYPPPHTHTLFPKQNPQKLQTSLLQPHRRTQRAENDRRGRAQRCRETPALVPLLCLIMAGVQEQLLLLTAKDIRDRPLHQPGAASVWAGGRRGGRRWLYTKVKAHFARSVDTPFHPGVGGGGPAFKLSHISHSTKGRRGLPYGSTLLKKKENQESTNGRWSSAQ